MVGREGGEIQAALKVKFLDQVNLENSHPLILKVQTRVLWINRADFQ